MIDTLNAVFLFFDLSPKRQRFLERILKHLAPDMRKRKLVGMCKTRLVERHICYVCECLKAILNLSEYHDIYEEVALTGSWDQETRTKAQGLLTSLTSSRATIMRLKRHEIEEEYSVWYKKEYIVWYKEEYIVWYKEEYIVWYKEEYSVWYKEEYSVWYKEEYSVWYKEEYSVWYKDATCLATLLGTSISAPGTPR